MKPTEEKTRSNPSDLPVYLFKQGNNCEAYRYFGAHIEQRAGETGVVFRVWAPHATAISVVGDFNSWKPGSHPMRKVDNDSVWELFIPGMKEYDVYKYCVTTRAGDLVYKADPYAFHAETRPSNGSKVYDLNGFVWHDEAWQNAQKKADVINGPMNIYEMHAGSWKMKEGGLPYNYSELADELIPYITEMGYTHVELLPVTGWSYAEHSPVRDVFVESYRELFGSELRIESIHAGLECGLFAEALHGLDAIAVGPTLSDVHTPDESMELASAERFYELLIDVLKRLAA